MLDTPAPFTGVQGNNIDTSRVKEVRIGLFAPDKEAPTGISMTRGAQLAVKDLNRAGGYYGLPFRIVQRWAFDPWGAGSREMIKLAYKDSVLAVIGSTDGNTTHIAEQIVTKARIPLISPVSSDPTLTYINLPWIFRLPPEDKTQIQTIIDHITEVNLNKRIGIITSTSHDGRTFLKELTAALTEERRPPVCSFQIDSRHHDYPKVIRKLTEFSPDLVVINTTSEMLHLLLRTLTEQNSDIPVYLPWIPSIDDKKLQKNYIGKIHRIIPFEGTTSQYQGFVKSYKDAYGERPDYAAAYTYDSVVLVARSLQSSPLNRVLLRKNLSQIKSFEGVSGSVLWDNGGGNRMATPSISTLSE